MSDITVTDLASSKGFTYIGQVASYAALQITVPTAVGQHILLEAYNDGSSATGWKTLGKSPLGGGEFVAFSGYHADDGGSIVQVNNDWHWRRVIKDHYTPEMFGADGSGKDDKTAISNAVNAAVLAGVDEVRGEGFTP